MAMTMWYYLPYVIVSKPNITVNSFQMLIVTLFVIMSVSTYFAITVIVYFFVKKNDWKFTLVRKTMSRTHS